MKNIKEFVNWYYCDEDYFFITLIDNKTGSTRNYYHNKKSFFENFKQIVYSNTELQRSIYFSINSFKSEDNCEVNDYDQPRKTKLNVKQIKSIVFDFDEPDSSVHDCSKLIKSLGIIPSYILETSPKKFQVCYKLNENDIDFKEYELINKTLAKKFRADINVCSVEKVFRLPYFINHKNSFQCKLLKSNNELSYNFSLFKNKVGEFISQNEKLKEYHDTLQAKHIQNKTKITKSSTKYSKVPTKAKKHTKNSFKSDVLLQIDNKLIRKYKMLLKFNQNDASIADILYIKYKAKSSDSYDDIFNEIISIRDILDKPFKRDISTYYYDRSQFHDTCT